MYRNYIKPSLDFIFALLLLVVLFIPMIVIWVIVKADSPGPALFWQKRVGINSAHFMMPKFRTMRMDAPKNTPTHLLSSAESYITRSGKFLRKFSLDELPQLLSILTFKMSFVGPRPALWNQYDLLAERNKYGANAVRPGLTGWAQVNGRDELPIAVKACYDGEYCERMSFMFDLKCVFLTVWKVLKHEGVVEGGVHCDSSQR